MNALKDKNILVTGGTGSIGSELVRQALKQDPRVVRILDHEENALFNFQHDLKEHNNVRFLVGDVRDEQRLRRAMENVDIVFHSAALKHVPSCEYNPIEAVKTNVYGTQTVINAALDSGVKKAIFISTDKAVTPVGTMGATKLVAERLFSSAQFLAGEEKTTFSSVRFGNVIGSRGSVLDLFKNQISKGGPVTITDQGMTRFVMTIPQAVNLILTLPEIMQGGELFVLKTMKAFNIIDFAKVLIKEFAPKCNLDPAQIKIENIGIRPGEKLYESLMTEEEAKTALETENLFIIKPPLSKYLTDQELEYAGAKKTEVVKYDSNNVELLNQEQIKEWLLKWKLL